MIQNNLPPESQQWARDLERRVQATERGLFNNSAQDSAARATLGGVQTSINTLNRQSLSRTVQRRAQRDYSFTVPNPGGTGRQRRLVDTFPITIPPNSFVWATLTGYAYYDLTGYSGLLPGSHEIGLVGRPDDFFATTIARQTIYRPEGTGTSLSYGAVLYVRAVEAQMFTTSWEYPDVFNYEVFVDYSGVGASGGSLTISGSASVVFETVYADADTYTPL